MVPASKVRVRLSQEQRDSLGRVVRTGTRSAAMRRRAIILLKAGADGPDGWADEAIAAHLETTRMTVMRVRRQFAAEGLDATLHRKKPTGRQYRKLDGNQEAQLVALACSAAPEGRPRWTMRLLADKLVELEVVESIDPATVCRTLKKTASSRSWNSSGSFRPRRTRRSWRTGRTCSRRTKSRTIPSAPWRAWTRAASR